MRKEFLIAIISGITIGVIVAFGIWRVNSALKSEEISVPKNESEIENDITPTNGQQLTIIRPEEDDVITSTPVQISGISKANITLIVSGEKEDYIIETANDGSFELEVDLVGGVNEILFAHSEDNKAMQTKSLRLIYSSEFEKEVSE